LKRSPRTSTYVDDTLLHVLKSNWFWMCFDNGFVWV